LLPKKSWKATNGQHRDRDLRSLIVKKVLNVVPEPQYVINFKHLSLSFMIFQIKILSSSQPGGKFKTMKKSANKMIK
jgi:hypothetical protein